jgi:hypothetical protein
MYRSDIPQAGAKYYWEVQRQQGRRHDEKCKDSQAA